ncbi:hypothetical protein [Pseudoduganella namucuonensis]|uniref:hypothetical protein n=1 Tax=Pseudoduganella namucuonensis TaxID=1035707 RepID=UPI001160ADD0|nr:hypothetical protein [Pseudoduganella namucuonensis]
MKTLLYIAMVPVCFAIGTGAQAVSLAGRATDDTVCDLSPLTTYRLTRRVFVPAGTTRVSEIYTRLALQFITTECKNGQTLILHSDLGNSADERAFRDVTGELCSSAEVNRETAATREYPHAFQIKCKLLKIQEARDRLVAAERATTVEQMIQERAPVQRNVEMDESVDKPGECGGKITFGSLLGLGGRCR